MKLRPFGWTREPVSIIGQGTWNLEQAPRAQALRALHAGIDAGMNLVDTAEMYGDGAVETIVGEALDRYRDKVFLVTKVLPKNASRHGTIEACNRSLSRLRTDRIDLYLLHWPSTHPLADTLAAFEALKEQGKIRYWGLSNFDTQGLDEALAIGGPRGVASNQVLYHLQERAIEHAVLGWCDRHSVAVMAYSPFGSGNFPGPESAGGKVLAAIARDYGATPHQAALAYLARHERVFVIPKASSAPHAEENAGAAKVSLTPKDVAQIERAFPLGPKPSHLPTL